MKFLVIFSIVIGISLAQFHQGPKRPQQFQAQQQQQQQNNQQDQYQNVDDQQPQQQQQQYKSQPQQQSYQSNNQNYNQRHESTTFIPIIRFDKEQGNDGSYKAAWETGNNILAQEEGFLKSLGPNPDVEGEELNAQVQQGSYTYTSPEGQVITVHYTADEKGFHPTGDHLPTPPPVSPEVQKGLDLIYAGIRAQEQARANNPQLKTISPDHNGQYREDYNNNNNYNQNNNNNNNQQQFRQQQPPLQQNYQQKANQNQQNQYRQ